VSAGEAVSREDALRMMTIDAARFTFDEANRGSIEVGKHADLVVLTEDLMTCPPDRIRSIRAAMTLAGGRVVFERREP
jgi:predicted amidohydrolase YtcJ